MKHTPHAHGQDPSADDVSFCTGATLFLLRFKRGIWGISKAPVCTGSDPGMLIMSMMDDTDTGGRT
jgi:hypothetical protein